MGTKERHERDREAVRHSILEAARELFITEGFPNVSIRKIAERIEYSPAAIYGYFASKDDIFFALAEEGFRLLGDPGAGPALTELEHLAPLDRLRSIFMRLHRFSREHPRYFALMFVERSVPRISREYERFAFAREMKRHLVDHVQSCIDAGVLPPTVKPFVAIRLLTMSIVGLATLSLSDRLAPGEDPDRLAADAINVVLAGLQSGVSLESTGEVDCPAGDAAVPDVQRVNEESFRR
jgi:AcrR family transcriptional regulator